MITDASLAAKNHSQPTSSPSSSKMAIFNSLLKPKPPAPIASIGAPPSYFTNEGYVQNYLAAPEQQTATMPSRSKAPKSAVNLARQKQAAAKASSNKRSRTFSVARSEKKRIPDENKMNENRLKKIMEPQSSKDVYNRYLRKLVANAKTTARNSKSLKFVPILSPRTGELMIITATGQHLAFNMNNPKHLMEVASMAAHAGMSTEQLSAWASNYSRGLSELDNVEGLTMNVPDATFNPNAKQDFKKLIQFNTPSPDKLYIPQVPSVSGQEKPQSGISIPQVPTVSQ